MMSNREHLSCRRIQPDRFRDEPRSQIGRHAGEHGIPVIVALAGKKHDGVEMPHNAGGIDREIDVRRTAP